MIGSSFTAAVLIFFTLSLGASLQFWRICRRQNIYCTVPSCLGALLMLITVLANPVLILCTSNVNSSGIHYLAHLGKGRLGGLGMFVASDFDLLFFS